MLTRISEIIQALQPIQEGEAFFEFWPSLETNAVKRKVFHDIECHLADVDEEQWKSLLPRVVEKFRTKVNYRGWQQAYDALHEGIAFSFLKRDGFGDIEFLPVHQTQKTPDLKARRGQRSIRIEVKSINPSKDEVQARQNGTPRCTGQPLTEEFFSKLQKTLAHASEQLAARQCDEKVIFVFLEFDDLLNEYVENDLRQIKVWLKTHKMFADKYYIHSQPGYYFTSPQSDPPNLIVWPPDHDGVVARH